MTDSTNVPMPHPTLHAGQRLATSGFTRSAVADYGNARAAERDEIWRAEVERLKGALPALPPLDDELRNILGRICFTLIPVVQVLRRGGHKIEHKAEDEQAAAIHWMLGHYFAHGAEWRGAAKADLERMQAAAESTSVESYVVTGVQVKTE